MLIGTKNSYSYTDVRVSFGFFYQSLTPYGEWIEIEPDFYVWRPISVRYGWRPYWDGRWVWTRYGWYWVATEPFGWIVFHYGRWYYDDYYGWIWIPGYEWAPAWVEWRYNDAYIGWAPLPPYALFRVGVGIHFTKRWHHHPHHWTFIKYRNFHSENPNRYYEDPKRVERIFGNTRQAIDYRYEDNRIINRGIEPEYIERKTGKRIIQTEIIENRTNRGERFIRESEQPKIEIYRPDEHEIDRYRQDRIEARRSERKLNIDLDKIDRTIFDERKSTRMDEREIRTETRERNQYERQYPRESEQRIEHQRRIETRDAQRETERVRPEPKREKERKIEPKREYKPERREREIEIRRERVPSREDRSEPRIQERPRERQEGGRQSRERKR